MVSSWEGDVGSATSFDLRTMYRLRASRWASTREASSPSCVSSSATRAAAGRQRVGAELGEIPLAPLGQDDAAGAVGGLVHHDPDAAPLEAVGRGQTRDPGPDDRYRRHVEARAASIAASSASPWTADVNAASNAEGGRYTPAVEHRVEEGVVRRRGRCARAAAKSRTGRRGEERREHGADPLHRHRHAGLGRAPLDRLRHLLAQTPRPVPTFPDAPARRASARPAAIASGLPDSVPAW